MPESLREPFREGFRGVSCSEIGGYLPLKVTTQSRAPDIPARRQGIVKSWRLNAEERDDLEYLVDVWFEDEPGMTANGAVRRAIRETAARERGRRRSSP